MTFQDIKNRIRTDKTLRTYLILICVCVIALAGVGIFNVVKQNRPASEERLQGNAMPVIAEGNDNDNLGNTSMMDAHERSKALEGRNNRTAEIWSNATPATDDLDLNTDKVKAEQNQQQGVTSQGSMSQQDALAFFGQQPVQQQPEATTPPPAPRTSSGSGSGRTLAASKSTEERMAEANEYVRSQGIDPVTGLPITQEQTTTDTKTEETVKEEAPAPVQVRRSGGISSLGEDLGSMGNLDSESEYITEDASKPYKVIFVRDQKIQSGDRVTVRLIEDLPIAGVLIPKNTLLQATATINERVQLDVTSFEMHGKIYSMKYTAYDKDGALGLYCPQSQANKTAKEGTQQGMTIGSTVLGTGISGVAGTIVNAGTQLVRSASGNVTVSLVSGYEFYLMQKKN